MAPNPNSNVANDEIDMIINLFWKEFGHFQNKTGAYSYFPSRFLLPDAPNGNSFLLYQIYSLPYTSVLGLVACCITSKRLGKGSAERSRSGVKEVKDGK